MENLKCMHDYQSLMGEIQDVEVIMQALTDAPVNVSSFDPEPVRRYYERCHAKAISAYLETYESIGYVLASCARSTISLGEIT